MKAPFSSLVSLMLVVVAFQASAEQFTIFLPELHFTKVSLESVLGARVEVDDDEEDLVIGYYEPGQQLATFDVEGLDLANHFEECRQADEIGPFFGEADIYLIRDGRGRFFLLHYEFEPGNRFRFGPLSPLAEESQVFVLQGLMQASFHPLVEKLSNVAKEPASLKRRRNMGKVLEAAMRKLMGEQDGADQPATAPESSVEEKKEVKPESEGRPQ